MNNPVYRQALSCAERGWPVFPCQWNSKVPVTRHGYLDASTDPAQIREWFARHPHRNLAVATGAPGPDILDIGYDGPAANGFPALARLRSVGLLDGAAARIRTPSGGLHLYFAGSDQRSSHLPAAHVDFLAVGGYVLIPPSQVKGKPYQYAETLPGRGGLDWQAASQLMQPERGQQRQEPDASATPYDPEGPALRGRAQTQAPQLPGAERLDKLARWVAVLPEGNRNAALFWAANRALEADHAADLSPLAVAAREAGLGEPEIARTLNSARRIAQAGRRTHDRQAEGGN